MIHENIIVLWPSQLNTSYPCMKSVVMPLYRYFPEEAGGLPNSSRLLSEKVPSSSIFDANATVTEVINQDRASASKSGQYTKLSAEARAEIRKRAVMPKSVLPKSGPPGPFLAAKICPPGSFLAAKIGPPGPLRV